MTKFFWTTAAVLANTIVAMPFVQSADPVDGRWEGAVEVMGQTLPFAVTFTTSDTGLSATIDIQGATNLPLRNVTHEGTAVRFELPAGPGLAVWDGEHQADSIGGTFTQGAAAGTFAMRRATAPPTEARADDDPPPYREIEVQFGHDDVSLAGTLTVPPGAGRYPAAVLISGSGAQNRDEELFGFRPFRIIADRLTRRGIAVLRYDDRGIGGSTGNTLEATTADFADDVAAALRFLRARAEIDPQRLGLIGHSEGGIVAPMVAARDPQIAFVVLLAGTSVPGEAILLEQGALIARSGGASEAEIENQRDIQRRTFAAVRSGTGWDELERDVGAQIRTTLDTMPADRRANIKNVDVYVETQARSALAAARTPWFAFFLDYDPATHLNQLRTPVLALFGELDLQVPPAQNRGPLEAALATAGNPDVTIRVLPDANHLFQKAVTGSPSEYASLEKRFVPGMIELLGDWIGERVGAN